MFFDEIEIGAICGIRHECREPQGCHVWVIREKRGELVRLESVDGAAEIGVHYTHLITAERARKRLLVLREIGAENVIDRGEWEKLIGFEGAYLVNPHTRAFVEERYRKGWEEMAHAHELEAEKQKERWWMKWRKRRKTAWRSRR